MLTKTIIKSAMPVIKKALESKEIDNALHSFKEGYNSMIRENEEIVIVNTTEITQDGTMEYLNICIMDANHKVTPIEQMPLNEAVKKLIQNI
jgi:hypothetical protein